MTYKTGDRVNGTLINAAAKDSGFGFLKPDGGGENIYIAVNVMRSCGADITDVGSRFTGYILLRPTDGAPYIGMLVRLDDHIEGEELDAVDREVLRRLAKLERGLAKLLERVGGRP